MSENKQPMFGDGNVNHKGNNGYGYEEHEQYVKSPRINISSEDFEQPDRGDMADNFKGDDGYGYEEHEQFVTNPRTTRESELLEDEGVDMPGPTADEPLFHDDLESESLFNNDVRNTDAFVEIMAGPDSHAIMGLAETWRMDYVGGIEYDSGEQRNDANIEADTAMYFDNKIPNKSKAFMTAVEKEFPDARVGINSLVEEADMDKNAFLTVDLDGLDLDSDMEL